MSKVKIFVHILHDNRELKCLNNLHTNDCVLGEWIRADFTEYKIFECLNYLDKNEYLLEKKI